MWSNFHNHSHYCDGKGKPIDHVRSAQEKGVISLGFSSHAPLPFDCKWCMKKENLDSYLSEIESLKRREQDLEVYKSLEIDFIPEVISPNDFKNQLDYTIGSIHFVDQFTDGRRWEIDGLHTFFLEGLQEIFKNNIRDAIARYFELTREMVTTACPTIIGHLDKIKIQNTDDKFYKETDVWYQSEVLKTLNVIEKSGAIVEVNTRGLYQKKSSTPYPSPWILEIIHKKNIPITLSSDSHHPDDIINQFPETANTLKKIGFKKISVLKENQWQPFEFNEHGIILH